MAIAGLRGGGARVQIQRYHPQISSKRNKSSTLKQIAHSLPCNNGGMGIKLAEENRISFKVLEERLGSKEWALADQETRRLLIVLAGEAAVKRNYVFFSEVYFIPASHLNAIDELWRKHSNDRFGYSVQRRIWNKVNQDFTDFFKKVGWMKRLEAEQEQYSYRSFPGEFIWDLTDSTPEGHLPLTNALRGTQLLATILQHPAFLHHDQDDIHGFIPNYNL